MWPYTRKQAPRRKWAGDGATTAAPQPPQPPHFASSQLFASASAQVTACSSGSVQQQSDINGYHSDWFAGKQNKQECNADHSEDVKDDNEEPEHWQVESCAEEDKEIGMDVERDMYLHKKDREKSSSVVCTLTGYAIVNECRMRTDEVTRGYAKQACIEKEVLEVSMSASNPQMWNIKKVVPFSKQPAKVDPIENTTRKEPKALTGQCKKAPA